MKKRRGFLICWDLDKQGNTLLGGRIKSFHKRNFEDTYFPKYKLIINFSKMIKDEHMKICMLHDKNWQSEEPKTLKRE